MNQRLREFAAAVGLLTRLPIYRLIPQSPLRIEASVWAYPIVGLLVGACGGVLFFLCSRAGIPAMVAAIWILAAMLLITGALHEDGLADTADGFGGGGTPERKRAIMRDSQIGSFGAASLILALASRGAAIAIMASPGRVIVALMVAGALSRAAIIVVLLTSSPARSDGIAASLSSIPSWASIAGLASAGLIAALMLPTGTSLVCVALAVTTGLAASWLSTRQIGGHTGDVLGATAVISECLLLGVLSGR